MWLYSPFSHMTQLAAQVSVLHSVTLNASDVKPNLGDTQPFFCPCSSDQIQLCVLVLTYTASMTK